MSEIKRFNQMVTEGAEPLLSSPSVLDHLKDGDAILVNKEDSKKFYDTLGYYIWIEFTRHPDDVLPEQLYYVLIGNKIYNTDKPSFGGQDFTVFEPTWDDLKPYKEIN